MAKSERDPALQAAVARWHREHVRSGASRDVKRLRSIDWFDQSAEEHF